MKIFLAVLWCICIFFNGANMSTSIDKERYGSAAMWALCGIMWTICVALRVAGL